MQQASLQRADLSGARSVPPTCAAPRSGKRPRHCARACNSPIMSGLVARAVNADDARTIKAWVDRIRTSGPSAKCCERSIRYSIRPSSPLGMTPERQTWQSYITASQSAAQDSYSKDLTEHLTSLMCKTRFSSGSVATGIAQRAQNVMFRGQPPGGVRPPAREGLPGSGRDLARLMQHMAATIDAALGIGARRRRARAEVRMPAYVIADIEVTDRRRMTPTQRGVGATSRSSAAASWSAAVRSSRSRAAGPPSASSCSSFRTWPHSRPGMARRTTSPCSTASFGLGQLIAVRGV